MGNLQQFSLSEADIKTLILAGVIPQGTPAPQIQIFSAVCRELQLSPYSREIYLLPIGGKYCPIVGINGLRRIASKTGKHAGTDDCKFDLQSDGSYKTAAALMAEKRLPETATSTVYRMIDGYRAPFTATVAFREFTKSGGQWGVMPFQMIGKVAEAFALRKAFADYGFGGVFVEEEQHAIEVIQIATNEEVERLRSSVLHTIEQATGMDSRQENAAIERTNSAATKEELLQILERVKNYLPAEQDPAKQFKNMKL